MKEGKAQPRASTSTAPPVSGVTIKTAAARAIYLQSFSHQEVTVDCRFCQPLCTFCVVEYQRPPLTPTPAPAVGTGFGNEYTNSL